MKFKFLMILCFGISISIFSSEKHKNQFNIDVLIAEQMFKRLKDDPFKYLETNTNDTVLLNIPYYSPYDESDRHHVLEGGSGTLNIHWSNHLFGIQTNNNAFYPEIMWLKKSHGNDLFLRHEFIDAFFSNELSNYYPGLVYRNKTQFNYRDIYLGFDIELDTSEEVLFIPYSTGHVAGKLFRKSNVKETKSDNKSDNNFLLRNEFHFNWTHLNPKLDYFTEIPSYFDNLSLRYGITDYLETNYNIDYWKRDGIFPHRLSNIKLKYAFGKDNVINVSSTFYDTRSHLVSRNAFYHDFKDAYYSVGYSKNNFNEKKDSTYNRELNKNEYYVNSVYGFSVGGDGYRNLLRGGFGYGVKQGITLNINGYWEQLPSNTTRGLLNLSCVYNKYSNKKSNNKDNLVMILSYYPFVYQKYETQTYRLLGDPYYYYSYLFNEIQGFPYTIPKTVDVMYWNLGFYIEKSFSKVRQISFNIKSANTPVMNTSQIRNGFACQIKMRRILNKNIVLNFFISGLYSTGVKGTVLNQNGDEYYFNNTLMPFRSTEEFNVTGGIHASFSF